MQNNPNAASWQNGLPMLYMYQDIFERQCATGSFPYHSTSTYVRPSQFDDIPLGDEDSCTDEIMNTYRFCPSMNTSSRSIGKGKSTVRHNRQTRADLIIDTLRELVNKVGGDGDGDKPIEPTQSLVSALDKSSHILQQMSLEPRMYAHLLDYLLKNPNVQFVFNNMEPSLHMQWVHIIAASLATPPPPSCSPHPPPLF